MVKRLFQKEGNQRGVTSQWASSFITGDNMTWDILK